MLQISYILDDYKPAWNSRVPTEFPAIINTTNYKELYFYRLGAFFSPLIPAICVAKLFIFFYTKKVRGNTLYITTYFVV